MVIRYPATKARVNFGEILSQVADQGDEVIIERLGEPVARISPYSKSQPQLLALRRRIAKYVKAGNAAAAVRADRTAH